MTKIVFTGQAVDHWGAPILRATLATECLRQGFLVQSAVKGDTNVLVASRSDTTKARAAAARGIRVMTYPEFLTAALPGVSFSH